MRIHVAAAALILLVASSVQAAAPAVPASFSYQGVLLDNAGQPQSGPVDLTVRLWDQGFAGTLLYKQEFNNTVLVDGVFAVKLGPTGVGVDVPTSPLTLNLVDAVTTDLGASGAVWIEVSVDGNPPLNRTQFQAVPFALKAESATQAETTTNLLTPAGVDSTILDAIWQNFNFDGGGPANTDPSEGAGDADLDGLLNFVDPDNDNDGISDAEETTQGSNINLVTPRIDSISANPTQIFSRTLSATGNSFDPGMTVVLGAASVTPTSVTSTSFDFVAPPMPPGVQVLVATHPNGESGSLDVTYDPVAFGEASDPIEAVALGVDGLLIHSDANFAQDTVDDGQVSFAFPATVAFAEDKTTSVHWDSSGRLAALRKNTSNGLVEVVIDTDLDGDLEASEAITFFGVGPGAMTGASLIHDPADQVAFAYLRSTLTQTRVQIGHDRDGNGDFTGIGETLVAEFVPGGSITGTLALGELAADSANRLAYVFEAPVNSEIRVAWDRSGDGDFNDTVSGNPEIFSAATSTPTCVGSDFDASDRLAIVYGDGSGLHLLHDTSGDGDFGDAGEAVTLTAVGQVSTPTGCDVDASGTGLTIAVTDGVNLSLLVDRNGDADFADTNEDVQILSGSSAPLAVERLGNGTAVVVGTDYLVLDPN